MKSVQTSLNNFLFRKIDQAHFAPKKNPHICEDFIYLWAQRDYIPHCYHSCK